MESVESDKGPTLKDWVEFILCIAVMSGGEMIRKIMVVVLSVLLKFLCPLIQSSKKLLPHTGIREVHSMSNKLCCYAP